VDFWVATRRAIHISKDRRPRREWKAKEKVVIKKERGVLAVSMTRILHTKWRWWVERTRRGLRSEEVYLSKSLVRRSNCKSFLIMQNNQFSVAADPWHHGSSVVVCSLSFLRPCIPTGRRWFRYAMHDSGSLSAPVATTSEMYVRFQRRPRRSKNKSKSARVQERGRNCHQEAIRGLDIWVPLEVSVNSNGHLEERNVENIVLAPMLHLGYDGGNNHFPHVHLSRLFTSDLAILCKRRASVISETVLKIIQCLTWFLGARISPIIGLYSLRMVDFRDVQK